MRCARESKPSAVDVLLTEKCGKSYIHMINLLGEHRSNTVCTFDYIPPVCDVDITCALPQAPAQVCCQPGNRPIAWKMEEKTLRIHLDKVELYDIIEITYE